MTAAIATPAHAAGHIEPVVAVSGGTYGFVDDAGVYGTTLTDPVLFRGYYQEQIRLLLENHGGPVWVGISDRQIPLTFATEELTTDLPAEEVPRLGDMFHLPDLARNDDSIANGDHGKAAE